MPTYRSPLRYPGGKSKAIRDIARLLPAEMGEYREPMVGGGSVFFHVRSQGLAKSYWVNDLFADLFHFWRVAQDKEALALLMREMAALRERITPDEAKRLFYEVRNGPALSSFEEACRFFFYNRTSFSGTTQAGGYSEESFVKRFTASSVTRLRHLPAALEGVRITNLDFADVVSPPGNDVFLFLDPPYFSAAKLYGKQGTLHQFDHSRLAALLKSTEHRFLMTYDDCPEIRELYSWATLIPWTHQYGMSIKRGNEVFIANYEVSLPVPQRKPEPAKPVIQSGRVCPGKIGHRRCATIMEKAGGIWRCATCGATIRSTPLPMGGSDV